MAIFNFSQKIQEGTSEHVLMIATSLRLGLKIFPGVKIKNNLKKPKKSLKMAIFDSLIGKKRSNQDMLYMVFDVFSLADHESGVRIELGRY